MVSPSRIRDRIAQAVADERVRPGSTRDTERKVVAALRVSEVEAVVSTIAARQRITRGGRIIEFQRPPQVILDGQGAVVGIDAFVRVFIGTVEQQVDGNRICINPPCTVPDGTTHQETDPITGAIYDVANMREDPREAYLLWLTQSILTTPNAAGWRPR